jgi:uncharacterized membrane protein YoaT (DUF817 family)
LRTLLAFAIRQISAAIFGILMLGLIVLTFAFYPQDGALPRYDFVFLAALGIQIALIVTRMETLAEARVILVFHLVGTVMELFKTQVGSWSYPEDNFFRVAGVPLFSGFMYGSVGSYIARSWRLHDFRFDNYPPFWQTALLGIAVYINFFAHHYVWDIRWALFAATLLIFGSCWLWVRPASGAQIRLPLIALFCGIAGLIYLAENIATYGRAWVYPSQEAQWHVVPFSKFGSWFLLMIVSWVLVSALKRSTLYRS